MLPLLRPRPSAAAEPAALPPLLLRMPPAASSNPLSEPPQPVRAGKDGTEIEPAVAEELLGLLQKAPTAAPAADASASPLHAGGGAMAGGGGGGAGSGAAAAGGVPGMVGAGLMGMPDPFLVVSPASPAHRAVVAGWQGEVVPVSNGIRAQRWRQHSSCPLSPVEPARRWCATPWAGHAGRSGHEPDARDGGNESHDGSRCG